MSGDGFERGASSALRNTGRALLFAGAGVAMLLASTSPAFAADRNHNKIPDRWEREHHLSTVANRANQDPDKDGLTNFNEYRAGTNPFVKDSNHNGVKDGLEDRDKDSLVNLAEVKAHTNIRVADTNHDGVIDSLEDGDRDGLDNAEEFQVGTNPRLADSNHDGIDDGQSDADHDGVDNEQEFQEGTNPRSDDSDHDGVKDGSEIRGMITSFDVVTGTLVVTSRSHHQSIVTTVTIDSSTVLEWKTDEGEDLALSTEPTLTDLVVGARVHDIKVTLQPDGTLLATQVVLKAEEADGDNNDDDNDGDNQEEDITATVVSYEASTTTLVVQPIRHSDRSYTLLVAPGARFAWGEDILNPDHVAGASDLVAGKTVEVKATELNGVRTALRVVFHVAPMPEED